MDSQDRQPLGNRRKRHVSEGATTSRFPRRYKRRDRPGNGPSELPPAPQPGADGDDLAVTAPLARSEPPPAPLPPSPAPEEDTEVWFEHVPTNPTTTPDLSKLAEFADPKTFNKGNADTTPLADKLARDAKAEAATAASDLGGDDDHGIRVEWASARVPGDTGAEPEPAREARTDGGGASVPADVDGDAGGVAPEPVAPADEAELAAAEARAATEPVARPGSEQPRYFTILLAVTCLVVGVVLGALLFSQKGAAQPTCPDPAAHHAPSSPPP